MLIVEILPQRAKGCDSSKVPIVVLPERINIATRTKSVKVAILPERAKESIMITSIKLIKEATLPESHNSSEKYKQRQSFRKRRMATALSSGE